MPELPEVELAAAYLRDRLLGRPIASVDLERPVRSAALESLGAAAGRTLAGVRRRGKQLALDFDGGDTLLLHLGMTGRFAPLVEGGRPPHTRFVLSPQHGEGVVFVDPRRFARFFYVSTSTADLHPAWRALGPDALAADPAEWFGALRTTAAVKPALLDQHRLAGVGNIYACEGLWAAGLAPDTPAERLAADEVERLRAEIQAAMRETLRRDAGTPMRYLDERGVENPFRIYGREGAPCPRCGRPILRVSQAGRSTWFCASCQPPKPNPVDPAEPRKARSRRESPAR